MADKSIVVYDGPQGAVGLDACFDPAAETGIATLSYSLTANAFWVDSAQGAEGADTVQAASAWADGALGVDEYRVIKAYYFVDDHDVLHPLGVLVLRGQGRESLVPGSRENADEVSGLDGDIDFGSEFRPRVIELRVATKLDKTRRAEMLRQIAGHLLPRGPLRPLVFADDVERMYLVRPAGQVDLEQYPDYAEFTIPLKASDPFAIRSFEETLVGTGVAVNEGTVEAPVIIEIAGPAEAPSVQFGAEVLSYSGAVPDGQTLVIDTGSKTVSLGTVNALSGYSGGFPLLWPGSTPVTVPAAGITTVRWRSRWI